MKKQTIVTYHSIVHQERLEAGPYRRRRERERFSLAEIDNGRYPATKHEPINIRTLNVRTIRLEHKRKELAHIFDSVGMHVLGIVNHKIIHRANGDTVEYKSYEKCMVITLITWRNNKNDPCGGVRLMLSKVATVEYSLLTSLKTQNQL